MKYIKHFSNLSGQTEYLNSTELDTYLGYVDENDTVYYDDALPDYKKMYLTIKTLTAGDLSLANARSNVFNYSLDDGSTWNTLATGQTVSVEANKKVLFKAQGLTAIDVKGIGTINYTGNFNVYGNVMSLVYGDSFVGQEVMSNYQFGSLFANNGALLSAKSLALPAATLIRGCYREMFQGCTSLTVGPELPATTLALHCYFNMFNGCTNLTTAPQLPATTLINYCYGYMFSGCTSLTTAPELPATKLANRCYQSMFNGCSSLNYIKCLATDISASDCTDNWVYGVVPYGVVSTGTFVKAASMNDWTTGGYNGIPDGWTVQDA